MNSIITSSGASITGGHPMVEGPYDYLLEKNPPESENDLLAFIPVLTIGFGFMIYGIIAGWFF